MNSSARHSLIAAIEQYFSIPADDAESVLGELESCVCRGGDWLFRQNDAADCMYLLARGRLHRRDGKPFDDRDERRYTEFAASLSVLLETLVGLGRRMSTVS